MNVPVLTFFNNKGGVGKTSLVYHLSWMFAEMGRHALALDLDPQANLTAGFLDDDTLERSGKPRTNPTPFIAPSSRSPPSATCARRCSPPSRPDYILSRAMWRSPVLRRRSVARGLKAWATTTSTAPSGS